MAPNGVQVRQLTPRDRTIQPATPFVQSECTGGYLCGGDFQQQGCYASPDYSTCSYDSSSGESMCTVCICYGSTGGVCDSSSSSASTSTAQPDLYTGAGSRMSFSFKSFVVLLLFCLWFNSFGLFCCFWYFFLSSRCPSASSHFQISQFLFRCLVVRHWFRLVLSFFRFLRFPLFVAFKSGFCSEGLEGTFGDIQACGYVL
jgi:hypothetical protein